MSERETHACAHCGILDQPLKSCVQCRQRAYCSEACQKMHWKRGGHKTECEALRESSSANNARGRLPREPESNSNPITSPNLRPGRSGRAPAPAPASTSTTEPSVDGATNTNAAEPASGPSEPARAAAAVCSQKPPEAWVHWCFHCGAEGNKMMSKCQWQCQQAYYCSDDHQQRHWPKHARTCKAAVAALAQQATRQRLTRAVLGRGKEKVDGADEDDVCAICHSKRVDPVEVSCANAF